MQKTELNEPLFFSEISLEYKETKFPYDYMERGKSQTSLTETLKPNFFCVKMACVMHDCSNLLSLKLCVFLLFFYRDAVQILQNSNTSICGQWMIKITF